MVAWDPALVRVAVALEMREAGGGGEDPYEEPVDSKLELPANAAAVFPTFFAFLSLFFLSRKQLRHSLYARTLKPRLGVQRSQRIDRRICI